MNEKKHRKQFAECVRKNKSTEGKEGNNKEMNELELLKSPTKQSVESDVIVLKSGSKEMNTIIASFDAVPSMFLIHPVLHAL